MTVFIILGAIGLAVLVLSLIFGDIFDFDGGIVSLPAIAIGLVVFGASGALTHSLGLEIIWAYVISIVIGVFAMLLAGYMVKKLASSSDGVPRNVTGDTGTAMSDITGSSGEVALDDPNEIERRLAFADEMIPQGTRIRVVKHLGSRVKVEPLLNPSPSSPTQQPPQSTV